MRKGGWIAALLGAALTLALAGCAQQAAGVPDGTYAAQEEAALETQPESTASKTAADTVTKKDAGQDVGGIVLTDQAGCEVRLDGPAQKIVSCYYITTYACVALGLSDRLAGIESKAQKRPIYQLAAPALLQLPDVGTLKEFNVEAAAALDPDLVILPKRLQDYAETLKQLDIPVLVVYPENQKLLEEMLGLIGKACGAEERADSLLQYYRETEQELAAYTQTGTDVNVYMAGGASYLNVAPDGMYQADLIRRAGGNNAASGLEGDYWTEVSYEDMLSMNPDVIVVPSGASYSVGDLMGDAQLQEVAAVKEGAVYQMPKGLEEWDDPVPSGILGVRWLCSILHGDVYPMETMRKDAARFYESFYGFTMDESLLPDF